MTPFLQFFFNDIARILKILQRQLQLRAAWLFMLMALQSLLEVGFIITLTYLGMALTNSAGLKETYLFKAIFVTSIWLQDWAADPRNLLVLAGIVVIVVAVIKNIVSYFTTKETALLGEDISIAVGEEIMQRFLYRTYAWHLSPESATMFQRMVWRTSLAVLLCSLLSMYACILTLVVLFLSLVSQEPVLTSLVIGITGSVGFLLYKGIRRHVDSNATLSASSSSSETRSLLCATKGIREVIIYRQQPVFLNSLTVSLLQGRQPRTFLYMAPSIPTWVLEATGFTVVIAAIVYLVYVQNADTTRITTALGLLMLTAWRVLPYCNRIVSFQVSIRSVRPTTEAVLDLLESLRSSPSVPPPSPAPNFTFTNEITLKGVHFRYAGAAVDSLHDINITLRKGSQVGIIGPSGSGKSTLVGVLSGLLPPTQGNIAIDGCPLDPPRGAAFAALIGYVPQTPFLFAGTLAENIAFSHWGKPWDEERVLEACRKAAIDFVDTHPEGLNQPIGENGAGLSGGQAQRVSIARAMYTRPALLIFDEATSALDQANENSIQQTITDLAAEVTSVIIAHRLTTVENCHTLIWMDKGKVIMQAPPHEVLPLYREAQNQTIKDIQT